MSEKLLAWDKEFPLALKQRQDLLLRRREFLTSLVKSAVAVPILPLAGVLPGCDQTETKKTELLNLHPWKTFSVVQEHLFPNDQNGPGAGDVNATSYLKFVLDAPDTDEEERKFILEGVTWLDGIAEEQKGKAFLRLSFDDQEPVLKKIADSRAGGSWLSYLLLYILEALLSDPVYGGNPDGIGWKWLQHQPGFPRPPDNKRYTELL